jgi:hypothetical protein
MTGSPAIARGIDRRRPLAAETHRASRRTVSSRASGWQAPTAAYQLARVAEDVLLDGDFVKIRPTGVAINTVPRALGYIPLTAGSRQQWIS